jgi:hypothetical protein
MRLPLLGEEERLKEEIEQLEAERESLRIILCEIKDHLLACGEARYSKTHSGYDNPVASDYEGQLNSNEVWILGWVKQALKGE